MCSIDRAELHQVVKPRNAWVTADHYCPKLQADTRIFARKKEQYATNRDLRRLCCILQSSGMLKDHYRIQLDDSLS